MTNEAPSALAPYRVLDLTGEIGQYDGRALAEMGADVIKIEPPAGDPVRRTGPFYKDEPGTERSLLWFVLNASKRGVTLDLEQPEGRDLFRKLVANADLVLESEAPGRLRGLGIDYEDLRGGNEKLVWHSITGFGQDGPYRDYKWSDLVGLALGGLLNLFGEPGRPPVRARSSQAYYHASLASAFGAMVALYHARRTGRGQRVDASMQEIVTFTLAGPGGITGFWPLMKMNITRSGLGINLGFMVSKTLYACKDGYVAVSTLFGPHFPMLIDLMKKDNAAGFLEEEKWRTATRFSPLPGQWQCNQDEANACEAQFGQWLMLHTKAAIMAMAHEHELMIFPVQTVPETFGSKQLAARNFFQRVEHKDLGGAITYPGPPAVLSGTPWRMRDRAPMLGEHNDAVYGALGVTDAELASLRERGVI